LNLYIDGVLKQTGTRSFSGSTPNTRGWNIGDFSAETNEVHGFRSVFSGVLDEVALYNNALSESEIDQVMSASSGDGLGEKEKEAALTTALSEGQSIGNISEQLIYEGGPRTCVISPDVTKI
jgi:hypothetical protein